MDGGLYQWDGWYRSGRFGLLGKEQTTESWTGDRAGLAGPGEDISMSPVDSKAISLCLVTRPWLPNTAIKCQVDQ